MKDLNARIHKLQKMLDKEIRLRDRKEGQKDALLEELKEKFGVGTLAEAEELLEEKERNLKQKQTKVEKLLSEFEEQFSDKLKGLDND